MAALTSPIAASPITSGSLRKTVSAAQRPISTTAAVSRRSSATLIYTDRDPVRDIEVVVGAERVRCLRTSAEKDFGSHIPVVGEQYAILVESDVPVVAQYGRAETREVAFYTTPGYCE